MKAMRGGWLIAAVLALAACGGGAGLHVVHFPHTEQEVLNPERGYFTEIDLVTGRDFRWVRAQGFTLAYAGVRLDAWRAAPLPPELLTALADGFTAARGAGIKVIVRFVYNHAGDGADAPREQILAHLAQLRPVLAANVDVIAVMDAGFIGAWGEWHSSTSGLDNPRDRRLVLDAVLAALPPSRAVTIRAPMYKAEAFGGPLTEAQAHDGSPASRVGHLNSCFLASDSDLGTYAPPLARWKDYVAADGRYTPVGGETCQLNPPRSDCATAREELARLRWSFLNALYQPTVLARWRDQGCYEEIGRRLGYRLELTWASFDERVAPGGVVNLTVRLTNTGYAAPFNPRPVYLTFDDERIEVPIDPRRWGPDAEVTISAALRVPSTATPGPHRLGLWLPDADPRLRVAGLDELYAIRFVNARWDGGVNLLTDRLVVDPAAPGPVDPRARTAALVR